MEWLPSNRSRAPCVETPALAQAYRRQNSRLEFGADMAGLVGVRAATSAMPVSHRLMRMHRRLFVCADVSDLRQPRARSRSGRALSLPCFCRHVNRLECVAWGRPEASLCRPRLWLDRLGLHVGHGFRHRSGFHVLPVATRGVRQRAHGHVPRIPGARRAPARLLAPPPPSGVAQRGPVLPQVSRPALGRTLGVDGVAVGARCVAMC